MKKSLILICWLFIAIFTSHSLIANETSAQDITENDFIIGDENAPITTVSYTHLTLPTILLV